MAEQPHRSGKPLMGLLYDTGTVAEPRISASGCSFVLCEYYLALTVLRPAAELYLFHPFKPSPTGLNLCG